MLSYFFRPARSHIIACVAASFSLLSHQAIAQQSNVAPAIVGTAGAAQIGAVEAIQTNAINSRPGGASSEGSGQAGGQNSSGSNFLMSGIFPTGRLAFTEHRGYDGTGTGHGPRAPFQAFEKSAFASVFANYHGILGGGFTRIGAFAGIMKIDVEVGAREHRPFEGKNGEGENTSGALGGYVLKAWGSTYAMATIAGFAGETTAQELRRGTLEADYNTRGVTVSLVAGKSFPLGIVLGGLKVSGTVQGGLNYSHHDGESYDVFDLDGRITQNLTTSLSAFKGALSASIYGIRTMDDGATLRPYVKVGLDHNFDYENEAVNVAFRQRTRPSGTFNFDDADIRGHAELGFDYNFGSYRFNGATNYVFSEDEDTFAGRLGLSVQLQ